MTQVRTSEQGKNKGHRWSKGQSGNPGGRPKKEVSITAILKDKLLEHYTDKNTNTTQTKAAWIVEVLIREALKGDMAAIREIVNRTDGLAKQTTEITGANGEPFTIQVIAGNGYTVPESGDTRTTSAVSGARRSNKV